MKEINADKLIHLPGELRYGVDCTLVAAHIWPVHVPDGTGISHILVGHVATPWIRLRRCAPCMDAQVSQAQDVLERPLICTTTNAHALHGWSSVAGGRKPGATSTPSNYRF